MSRVDVIVLDAHAAPDLAADAKRLAAHPDDVAVTVTVAAPATQAPATEDDADTLPPGVQRIAVPTTPEGGSASEPALASAALDATDAPYALLVRPSDQLLPGAIGRLVRASQRSGSAGAVGSWIALDDEGKPVGPEADPPPTARGRLGLSEFLDGYAPPSCCVLLSRRAMDRRRPVAALGESAHLDLSLRIVEQGDRFAAVPSVVARRRPSYVGVQGRWSALADQMRGVVRRSFARAATLGFEVAGHDLTEERENDAILRMTLRLATRAALADPDPRCAAATEMLRTVATRDSITPDMAAWAAADGLRRSEGFRPAIDGTSERLWSRAVRGWWSRFVGERWADKDLVDTGAGLLATRLISRSQIAAETLTDLAGLWSQGGRFCVAGSGAAARAMAAHAARAGCLVELLMPPGRAPGLQPSDIVATSELGQGSVVLRSLDADVGTDAPLVVIDTEGPELISPFASRPNVVRWSSARRRLEQRATGRLAGVWHSREVSRV